jgi:hypothetical protein
VKKNDDADKETMREEHKTRNRKIPEMSPAKWRRNVFKGEQAYSRRGNLNTPLSHKKVF